MLSYLSNGLGLEDFALFINRLLLGLFYVLARFRFFYDPSKRFRWFNRERFESLRNKMEHCGLKRYPGAWAWVVAIVEVLGGLMLILGIFASAVGAALFVLTLVATRCTWRKKVYEQNPVDCVDIVSCYLWRVEGLYLGMAAIVVLGGPGSFAILGG